MVNRHILAAFVTALSAFCFAAPALAQDEEEPEQALVAVQEELSPEDRVLVSCLGGDVEVTAREAACNELIAGKDKWRRKSGFSGRGNLHYAAGRHEEAFADYTAVIALDPKDVGGYMNRANAYIDTKKYDLAAADIKQALKLEPMSPPLHNQLCWVLALEAKDLDRAVSYCNIAIGIAPAYPPARDSRAMAYLKMNRFDLALADYEKASQLSPGGAHYMYGRGIALLRLGRKADGERWIKEALKADPQVGAQYESYGVTP